MSNQGDGSGNGAGPNGGGPSGDGSANGGSYDAGSTIGGVIAQAVAAYAPTNLDDMFGDNVYNNIDGANVVGSGNAHGGGGFFSPYDQTYYATPQQALAYMNNGIH